MSESLEGENKKRKNGVSSLILKDFRFLIVSHSAHVGPNLLKNQERAPYPQMNEPNPLISN